MNPARFLGWFKGPLQGIVAAICVGAECAPLQAQTSPDDPASELASFKLAPGFEANLFASETNGVIKPIQSRFDSRGRLWVIGSTVYPQLKPGQVPDDKVLILEDTNKDGVVDKTTTFASGLFIPTGLELTSNGCYVGNSTELLELTDTDGDGVADQRKVLLRGFGTGDNHQNINSFQLGPTGELWFSQGLHSHARVETPWGIERLDNAGIWRLNPRTLRLHSFLGSELPPHNPWGFVFDDWNQMFVLAGNGHGIYDTMPVTIRGHGVTPLDQIWTDHKGRKLCGGDIIGNSHLPDNWQGVMLVGGFMNHAVYALDIREQDSSFAIKDREPLLTSSHSSFRPVDVKIGPDGAIYVTDWYNPIIGHYQASFRHPDRDKQHGRIWRITAKNRPLVRSENLLNLGASALFQRLDSNDRFTRYHARRLLAQMPQKDVLLAYSQWRAQLKSDTLRSAQHLMQAAGLLAELDLLPSELLTQLFEAPDHHLRAFAASIVPHLTTVSSDALELLARSAKDPHPRVRLNAIVSLAWIPKVDAFMACLPASQLPVDKFIDYALTQAVHVQKPTWLPLLEQGRLGIEQDPRALEFLVRTDGTHDTVRVVRQLLLKRHPTRDQRLSLALLLAKIGDASDFEQLLPPLLFVSQGTHAIEQHAAVANAVAKAARERGIAATPKLASLVEDLLSGPVELQFAGLGLASSWKLSSLSPRIAALARLKTTSNSLRCAAAKSLGGIGDADSLKTLRLLTTSADSPQILRAAAASSLLAADPDFAIASTVRLLSIDLDEESATELLTSFSRRPGSYELLASALEQSTAKPDAAKLALRILNQTGQSHPRLLARLQTQAGFASGQLRATPDFVKQLAQETLEKGVTANGAEIFRRPDLACSNCHKVGNIGGTLGPDLNSIGSGQPLDFIIGAILEPNREVKENYESVELLLKNGDSITGYRIKSDDGFVQIRDIAQDEIVRIRKDQISKSVQRGSIMPQGLVDHLSRSELRDLLKYLSSLGKP